MLAVAHGTREADGVATTEALVDRVRALRPELRVERCFLDLVSPSLPEALARLRGEVVLVPLLLGTGYHVRVDIPAALADAPHLNACVARALGPDPLLAEALTDRLEEAGWREAGSRESGWREPGSREAGWRQAGSPEAERREAERRQAARPGASAPPSALVLAAAGSTDPAANADTAAMARLLGDRLLGSQLLPDRLYADRLPYRRGADAFPVVPAYLCAAGPTPEEAVASLRAAGHERVAVAPYLLGPGFFARRAARSGACVTSAPLGAHDTLARLVTLRYDEVVADRRRGPLRGRTGAHSGRMHTPE